MGLGRGPSPASGPTKILPSHVVQCSSWHRNHPPPGCHRQADEGDARELGAPASIKRSASGRGNACQMACEIAEFEGIRPDVCAKSKHKECFSTLIAVVLKMAWMHETSSKGEWHGVSNADVVRLCSVSPRAMLSCSRSVACKCEVCWQSH